MIKYTVIVKFTHLKNENTFTQVANTFGEAEEKILEWMDINGLSGFIKSIEYNGRV